MTSANVNLFVQAARPQAPEGKEVNATDKGAFKDLMNMNLSKSMPQNETSAVSTKATVKVDSYKSKINEANPTKEQKLSENEVKTVADKVEELSEDVKKVIADELDVDEEDIAKAMENLGFSVLDLLDTNNLAKLVAELTGQQDMIGLVLDDSFTNIINNISQLTDKLLDTGFSVEDIKDILNQFETVLSETANDAEAVVKIDTEVDLNADKAITNDVDSSMETSNVVAETEAKTIVKEINSDNATNDASTEITDTDAVDAKENIYSENSNSDNEMSDEEKEDEPTTNNFGSKVNIQVEKPVENEGMAVSANNKMGTVNTSEQVVTSPSGQTVSTQEIIDQIVENAKITNTEDVKSVQMVLNPEELGKVVLEVYEENGEVKAKLFTENTVVKEALENQMAVLKESLNEGGTKVTSIEVSVGTHEFEKNLEEQEHEKEQQQSNEEQPKRQRNLNLNELDGLTGLMSEEERLIAQIMKDNGGTVDYTA